MTVWNAATIGFVMSLAKPQRANNDVIRINVNKYFLGTNGFFISILTYF